MNLDRVSSGENCPDDIYVIVEIPSHSDPVKYEVDKHTGAMFVDRFMTTAMHYPCNYGYIPHTLSKDGDPIDVLVLTPVPLISGSKEEILDSIEMYKNAPEKPHFRS
jgi:inorganic pyrophosphatase